MPDETRPPQASVDLDLAVDASRQPSRPAGNSPASALEISAELCSFREDVHGLRRQQTAMTERLGDLRARDVIRQHNTVVREQLTAHGGYEVELQGDGFLLAFGSGRQAVLCAVAIQRAFAEHNASGAEEVIRVRIGLHTGEALRDADKFFGKTVILAARIANEANGGEIVVSSLLKQLTESTGDLVFGEQRAVQPKGIAGTVDVYSVEWGEGDSRLS